MLASTRNSKREMTIVSKESAIYTRREREKLGKFIVLFFFAVRFVIYVDEETEREKERKKKKKRDREIGKNHCFIVVSLFCPSFTSKKIRRDSVCVRNTTNGTYPKGMNKHIYFDYLLYERNVFIYMLFQ